MIYFFIRDPLCSGGRVPELFQVRKSFVSYCLPCLLSKGDFFVLRLYTKEDTGI